jgi:hypothetical protein
MSENFEIKDAPVEDLIEEFKYKIKPTQTHRDLLEAIEAYYKENENFMKKHNFEAGKRARKHLLNVWHLVRERRMEISGKIYEDKGADDAT